MEKRKQKATTDTQAIIASVVVLLFLALMVSWPTISTHIDVYSFYAETRGVGALYDLLVEKYYQ
ncbi:hypothetical protein NPN16_22385 [Vibrio parahaemolyticus]|uniref:hypothetical protein n=1 Tax=Vibrio parahaemolyticus TaxID=670 RepID=UPI00211366BD|nr:hypothetical protein [Vibrio parahaemolyticus]MCQ4503060.1 hypothetical protein [Vibrio parahaemolyticus]MCQ6458175.1 hypothetical protein [Vibrio parahaemolyticus]MCQ6463157.1 hypothetical protein [Vibrio parahaemolyticus]MCQ6468004.1 hypothetical protein [Vibrio parahaemolyticus]MCQ6473080.1 hypothetical protein [Vibrio parahaemolyticus]